jgi:hypothetical protein
MSHPSRAILQRLLEGRLGEARTLTIAAHVDRCGFCQDRLERLTPHAPPGLLLLPEQAGTTPAPRQERAGQGRGRRRRGGG